MSDRIVARHRRYLMPALDRKSAIAQLVLSARIERACRRTGWMCAILAVGFAIALAVNVLFHPFGQYDFYGNRISDNIEKSRSNSVPA